MAFQFPLAAVLRLRVSVEEHEQGKLEHIHHEIALALHRINALHEQSRQARAARERALTQPLQAYHLHASEVERAAIADRLTELNRCLQKLRTERERQLEVYQAARRKHEMLSEMRDHQKEAYDLKQARREQMAQDDIFGFRQKRS